MKHDQSALQNYPLVENASDKVLSLTGKRLDEITLPAIQNGEISKQDIRISPQTLLLQAEIAAAAGRYLLAENFQRAAEMCCLPDDTILDIYNALRPFRSTSADLEAIAEELENLHEAVLCAKLVREAAKIYRTRNLFKTDENGS